MPSGSQNPILREVQEVIDARGKDVYAANAEFEHGIANYGDSLFFAQQSGPLEKIVITLLVDDRAWHEERRKLVEELNAKGVR